MKGQFIILALFSFNVLFTQEISTESLIKSKTENEFKIMPYVNYDRNIKLMLGAMPMYLYKVDKNDDVSPKSLASAIAVYTTNKSYFVMGFTKMYLLENKWRLNAYILTGNLNSQIYIEDVTVSDFFDYSTITTTAGIKVERKIVNDLYGGLGYAYSHFQSRSESEEVGIDTDNSTKTIEIDLLSDKRDNVYYPKNGYKATVKLRTFQKWLGNENSADKIITNFNKYISARKNKDVIAVRYFGEFGLGDIAFEQQVVIGGKDIRGYSQGKYRGDGVIAIQGEYRYNFSEKMGAVGFLGLATLYGSINTDFDWDIYPGVGVGYRYKVFKESDFNIGIDAAVGKGDWGFSFRIGESF